MEDECEFYYFRLNIPQNYFIQSLHHVDNAKNRGLNFQVLWDVKSATLVTLCHCLCCVLHHVFKFSVKFASLTSNYTRRTPTSGRYITLFYAAPSVLSMRLTRVSQC